MGIFRLRAEFSLVCVPTEDRRGPWERVQIALDNLFARLQFTTNHEPRTTNHERSFIMPNEEHSIDALKKRVREFADERDWDQFHSPKNLSMALIAEAAELVEHFQWLTEEQSKNLPPEKLQEVEQELADIFIYLIRMTDKLGVDLMDAAFKKIRINEAKYPAEKVRGKAKKYTEYDIDDLDSNNNGY